MQASRNEHPALVSYFHELIENDLQLPEMNVEENVVDLVQDICHREQSSVYADSDNCPTLNYSDFVLVK